MTTNTADCQIIDLALATGRSFADIEGLTFGEAHYLAQVSLERIRAGAGRRRIGRGARR